MQRQYIGTLERTGASPGLLAQLSAKCRRQPLRRSFRIIDKYRRKTRSGWETVAVRTVAAGTDSGGDAAPASSRATLYPAGRRQVRLPLPALILTVDADALLGDTAVAEELGDAVTAGATAVVLAEGRGTTAAQLYDAAIKLKDLLRSRAVLLVRDRTDIADAAGADGVLLSPGGLPTVVAKRMLAGGLGLVGRMVADAGAAAEAAAEGASFVVLRGEVTGVPPTAAAAAAARSQQRSSASIPVLAIAPASASATQLAELMGAGVDGLALGLPDLTPVATALCQRPQSSTAMAAAALLNSLGATPDSLGAGSSTPGAAVASVSSVDLEEEAPAPLPWSAQGAAGVGAAAPAVAPAAQLSQLLSASREALVEAERELLSELQAFLEEACPGVEEAALLGDALKQLDELFLLVVVGEFNSGKSAVVNALLGQRYLAEGILPTTNEICVLKYGEDSEADAAGSSSAAVSSVDSEGVYMRRLPAELLREVNVVDTPGTNVILERQQRLTEEYVPRADLVLFVLSADRPFTDSEVRFLKYVRQWGKKVVFVVNKADLLSSEAEVEEVVTFVRDNARRLLGVDDARVLPVSARMAMEAKLSCRSASSSSSAGTSADSGRRPHFWPASAGMLTSHSDSEGEPTGSNAHGGAAQASGGGALSPEEAARLAADARWQRSRFEALERFIYRFLVAGAGASAASLASTYSSSEEEGEEGGAAPGESVRLKLQTPLFVAEALCEQAAACVGEELAAAREDVASLALVRSQLATFRREMGREGQLQREEVGRLIKAAAKRAGGVVDSVLKATNWVGLGSYLLSSSGVSAVGGKLLPVSRRMRAEGAGEEATGVRSMVREHGAWLADNCQRQVANYRTFAEQRAAALGTPLPMLLAGAAGPGAAGATAPAAAASSTGGSSSAAASLEAGLLGDLESDADARRRWRELRQAAAAAAADAADYGSWRRASRRGDDEDDASALAATGALDPRRTEILLEEEVREAVMSTASIAGGAAASGLVVTWVLPTTLEDLMALALAGMVGYLSVLGLPLRRAEAKRKLEALAASYAEDIQGKMERELTKALDACEAEVLALIAPLERLAEAAVERAEGHARRRGELAGRLESLKQRVANLE